LIFSPSIPLSAHPQVLSLEFAGFGHEKGKIGVRGKFSTFFLENRRRALPSFLSEIADTAQTENTKNDENAAIKLVIKEIHLI